VSLRQERGWLSKLMRPFRFEEFLDAAAWQIIKNCGVSDFEWSTWAEVSRGEYKEVLVGLEDSTSKPTLVFGAHREPILPFQCRDYAAVRGKLARLWSEGHGTRS
jgi:hypothetical protein